MQRFWALAVLWLASCWPVHSETFLVLPFVNASRTANLDWVGESIAETVRDALSAEGQIALEREDRQEAYRRLSIRPYVILTRATVMKLGETLDVDQIVYGEFRLTPPAAGEPQIKGTLRITAHLLDLKRLAGGREYQELGSLEDLAALQNHLAWQTLQFLIPQSAPSETEYLKAHPTVRVDAVENYIRGLLATTDDQKQKFFAQAARLDERYAPPCFRLGRLYWDRKNYRVAADWLQKVHGDNVHYREAAFFLGLSRYHLGDYAGAQTAFQSIVASVPLNEVWNNLGAAQLRAGNSGAALESFRKALEGDSNDPDYHFNVGYTLWKMGQYGAAASSFQAALERNSEDAQARQMLERARRDASTRVADVRPEITERVKSTYEETAYLQLKAVFDKK